MTNYHFYWVGDMRIWKQCFEQQIHSDISVESEFPYHRVFHGNQAIIQNFSTHCYTDDTGKRKETWTMNLFFQKTTKASLMFSKDIRLKKEGLWTLTHMSFVANRIEMISPAHGPAIKEHSYITFVYCFTNTSDVTGQSYYNFQNTVQFQSMSSWI